VNRVIVENSIWFDASREDVWRAITETDWIKQWWGDDSFGEITELRVGAAIEFRTEGAPILATIVVVDPPCEFAFRWTSRQQWDPIARNTRYLLHEENGGTRLTVTEERFEGMDGDVRQPGLKVVWER
jgi:uncharacterized protein YndB with AHSA1/START domain